MHQIEHTGASLSDDKCLQALEWIAEGATVFKCSKSLGCSWHTLDAALSNRFPAMYARARECQYMQLADQIVEIADTQEIGETEKYGPDGKLIELKRGDMIEHRRTRIDARKWLLSKVMRKKFGNDPPKDEDGDNTVKIVGGLPD